MSLYTKIMQQSVGLRHMLYGNAAGGLVYSALLNGPEKMNYYIRRGVVKHSTPGFYSYSVELDDGTCISCLPPDSGPGTMYGLGATDGTVITPGMGVVVIQGGIGSASGIILCACDNQTYSDTGEFRILKSDDGAGSTSFEKAPYKSDSLKKIGSPSVGMYKISDSYPGDWAMFNEFGAGYFLGRTRATVRASDMSRVDLFPINDQMRVAAGYFQMYTHSGIRRIFADNGGYVSEEKLFSPYVWETAGCLSSSDFDSKLQVPDNTNEPLPKLENPDMARYREYQGSIAGGRQIFVSYPEEKKNIGLAHVALSDSGAIILRSVSDIVISRTAHVDVPVRITDPEARKPDSKPKISAKDESRAPPKGGADWWGHDVGRRTAANTIEQQYLRFRDNADDWRLDTGSPRAEYDKSSSSKRGTSGGSAQIVLSQDGAIVLSTSQGAEIRLEGPNITISCPGRLSFRSGEDIVSISKQDIISKAKRNVETVARNNMTTSAEGRVSTFAGKSVYTETGKSEKKTDPKPFSEDNGSATPGIYFVSNEAAGSVVIDAQNINVHPRKNLEIRSIDLDSGKTRKSCDLVVGVGAIHLNSFAFAATVGAAEDPQAGIHIQGSSAFLYGKSVGVFGGTSAVLGTASEVATMMPVDDGPDTYSDLCSTNRSTRVRYLFDRYDLLADMPRFAYSSYDWGDDPALEEATWVNVGASGPSGVPSWGEELEINGTLPWPGKDAKVDTYRQNQLNFVNQDTAFGTKAQQDQEASKSLKHELVDFKDFKG